MDYGDESARGGDGGHAEDALMDEHLMELMAMDEHLMAFEEDDAMGTVLLLRILRVARFHRFMYAMSSSHASELSEVEARAMAVQSCAVRGSAQRHRAIRQQDLALLQLIIPMTHGFLSTSAVTWQPELLA